MNTLRQAAQQALEALKGADAIDTDMVEAIYSLYEALEQPEQEPLTDDQLDEIAVIARRGNLHDLRIAIEAAHGIKECNT